MDAIKISALNRPIDATVEIPGSKSITNRALLVAALAQGESILENALFSEDSEYFAIWGQLSIRSHEYYQY